ncbi:hypothetical protein ACE34P_002524 [Vibrio fluvialis]|uniref:hypothetical protein n=1 Tax=Vibrio fluvialis TaxID=676 RepID=UPI001C9D2A87|nr:hypothetical protein [Vibrio fluvialis]MBY7799187.1 hypothetical protein [Vibrio fluvialis]MBY8029179.1 hypothetical protein [Vibrio fluvialis]MBY8039110.1 hypothetical protein [Vibrio fluvialis]
MSTIKRHMENEQHKFDVATDIAIQAGVLQLCEYCDSTVFQGSGDIEDAYDLGADMYASGDLGNVFDSEQDMIDAIENTVQSGDHSGEVCFHCDEMINGDD